MANDLTANDLAATWNGKDRWLSDGGSRGSGRLVAKIGQCGPVFYFVYQGAAGGRRFWPIGTYDPKGKRGRKTLQAARDEAARLSALHREIGRDLHDYFEEERGAQEAARKAEAEGRRRAEAEAKRSSLRELLTAYVAHLERHGKQSAGDVRRIFAAHVYQAEPELAERRAAEIPVDDFVALIGKLTEAGKGRTAAKLRSYLRAAYSLAIKSKTDPAAPQALRTFGVQANPIASVGALSQFNKARDRHLSADELAAFLRRLDAVPAGVKKDALALCLLLGGQRPAQLLRLRPVDVDLAAGTITLHDPKGSRKQPRPHVLPLVGEAAAIMQRLTDGLADDAPLVFSSDGKRGLRPETVSEIVTEIATAMLEADPREARERFELRDLRRTCETMLAALKVPSDVRAQLQSHGLGGVQARHYDRHSYADEKRAALVKWQRHLDRLATGEAAKVVQMRGRK